MPGCCAIGDLGSKLGPVEVGRGDVDDDDSSGGEGRMTSVDEHLPLSGADSVVDSTLQLFVADQSQSFPPVACAVIRRYRARTGVATFNHQGVITGDITLTQESPLDPTLTRLRLRNLRSSGGEYRLHQWPVPQLLGLDVDPCGQRSVGPPFDPLHASKDHHHHSGGGYSPPPGLHSHHDYQVGDLSGKHGMLSGVNNTERTHRDLNLQLFGRHSALGRAMLVRVTLPSSTSPTWMCSNLLDTAEMTSALATFTFPVIGQALLQQRTGEPDSETYVYLQLDYADGSTDVTTDHAWAVHDRPAGDDMLSSDVSTRCVSTGDVMDPLGVVSTGSDLRQCRRSNPLRCKLGDLSGKHGGVSIRHQKGGAAIAYVIDPHLPLQGAHSVMGRSLVLRKAGGGEQYLACADLLKVWPLQASADRWMPGGEGVQGSRPVDHGAVTFTQRVGVLRTFTAIRIHLRHLPRHRAPTYLQVDKGHVADSQGHCHHLGDVFNPLRIPVVGGDSGAPPPTPPHAGDLTAKFGALTSSYTSSSSIQRTLLDPDLDLWGPWSVLEQIVLVMSVLDFEGVLDGLTHTVRCAQSQVVYPGGALTPTTVIIDLRKTSSNQTRGHEWHVHDRGVGGDSTARTGRCASTGDHYNPFRVNVQDNYHECHPSNPLRCELGDQSGKLGAYDMGSGPRMGSDVHLPLYGPHGVVGRSVVVHGAEGGGARIACADILPDDLVHRTTLSVLTPRTIHTGDVVDVVARAVRTAPYNMMVTPTGPHRPGCHRLTVYFLGMEAEQHHHTLRTILTENDTVLGMYRPVHCSAAVAISSMVLLLTSSSVGLLFSS
ncbi:uncharacterized protein LOC143294124 [Babylonia areolata]|uniref:uncharacterized protein LOC143294124 n=1 Tax=Babylonia areolata TaxID=304850 RepID=UPI003FD0EF3E